MRYIFIALLFFNICTQSLGQRFYSVVFDQLPQESQLFPRNDKNLGTISVSGVIEVPDWSYMSVVLLREDVRINYSRSNFIYPPNSNVAPFKFPDFTIKAEPAEYECQVYACKGKDSVLMISRKHLVAGDFYVISGQSNASAYGVGNVPYRYKNKYIRTFGLFANGLNLTSSDTLWYAPDDLPPYVGAWGLQIQRMIIEKHGIPTCFINGAIPGTFISNHLQRDVNNPSTIETLSGTLLRRVIKAKALNHVKAFMWFHGEGDIYSSSQTYPQDLTKLYGYWKTDYPAIQKFIIFQSNIHLSGNSTGASIREFQRKTSSIFPDVINYAVNGASGFDGNHHSREGYMQIGEEVYGILAPLFYNVTEKTAYHSPNLQQAYFNNQNHNSITLEFDNNQEMIIGSDTTVRGSITNTAITKKVQDYFFFDNDVNKTAKISGITTIKNKVIINFDEPLQYTKICYLPHYFTSPEISFFIGPCLKNIAGRRAFSFYNIAIGNAPASLTSPVLTTNAIYVDEIKLKWTPVNKASKYIIDRKTANSSFSQIATLDSLTTEWSDKGLQANTAYTYRVKAQSLFIDSDYSLESQASTPPYLSNPKLSAKIESINQIKLSWLSVPNAISYVLEKSIDNKSFKVLGILSDKTLEYTDKDIIYGTAYYYRIKALGSQTESSPSIAIFATPKELDIPFLKANIINKNTLNIQWKKSVGAKTYLLERSVNGISFTKLTQPDSTTLSFKDENLTENSNYYYRIKAIGDFTESKTDTISMRTPAILTTPALSSENITHESIKLNWKKIANASKYTLERQAQDETIFNKIFETDTLLTFLDVKLKSNLSYTYRLRATSNISESPFITISTKTLSILANQNEENTRFNIFPNPTKDKLNIAFIEPLTGTITLLDLSGKSIFEQKIINQKSILFDVSSLKKGIYLVIISSNQELYTQKIIVE